MSNPPASLFQLTRVDPVTGTVEPVSSGERIEAILAEPSAEAIVRSMDAQTLFGLIHEAGMGDAIELVEMATPAQVQSFIDFDCWTRDTFDLTRFHQWLPVVLDRDDDAFAAWYEQMDIELLALVLQDSCAVYLMEEDRDYLDTLEDAVVSSPCGVYALVFPDEDAPIELVRMLLDRVYSMNLIEGHRLLEAVRWELRSDMEEHALDRRTARMGDLGWVPFHEAMEVFAWRDPRVFAEEAWRRAIDPDARPVDGVGDLAPVDHHLQALDIARTALGETLLHRALASLPNAWPAEKVTSIADGFAAQFRALVNRAHGAERGIPGDIEGTTHAIERVIQRLSMGLELASKGDEVIAARVLGTTALRELHQAGHGAARRLATTASVLVRRGQLSVVDGSPLSLLVDAERDLFEGLLEPFPVRSRTSGEGFATLAQIETAATTVGQVAFCELLFFGQLRQTRAELAAMLFDPARCRSSVENVSFRTLAATLVLRRALSAPVELEPLPLASVEQAVRRLQDTGDVLSATRGHLEALLRDHARLDPSTTPVARRWIDTLAGWLADELEDVTLPLPAEVAATLFLLGPT